MLTLILLSPDSNRKPRTFHLDGDRPEVLGRHGKTVRLSDSRISREHAEVSVQNGVWVIRDLGSSNGTWVNGERISTLCELEEGDRLQIGRLTLIVGHVEVDLAIHDAVAVTELAPDDTDEVAVSADTLVQAEPTPDEPGEPDLQVAAGEPLGGVSSPHLPQPDVDPADSASSPDDSNEPGLRSADLGLDDSSAAGSLSDDSSIAPSDELEAAAALSEAEIEHLDGAAFDEMDDEDYLPPSASPQDADEADEADEDIYAESAGAITPVVSRPESPIDPTVSRDATPAEDQPEPVESADPPSTPAPADPAPEVVGLSLDMPAPEPGEQAQVPAEDPDVQETRVLDDEDESELPLAAAISDDLDAALDDGMTAEFLESLDDDDEIDSEAVAATAPEAVTGAAFTYDSAIPEEPAGHGHELAEPEEMQAIARPGRGGRRRKAVAAVLLLAAAAGGGWWATQQTLKPDVIAGRAPSDVTPPSEDAPDTPPTDGAMPTGDQPRPQADTDPKPAPPRGIADANELPPPPTADPFGSGPTLGARETPPAAPDETAPAVTPPADTAVDTVVQASSSQPDTTSKSSDAGPALAMLEPQPQEPWEPTRVTVIETPRPSPDESQDNQALPPAEDHAAAATLPARRIAFLVDASGSMVDSMNQGVLTWLETAIENLDERDQFTVVFFRSDEVFEVPPAGLRPAETLMQQNTIGWMSPQAGNIQPRGKSDPLDALRLARQYEATEVYILSDDKFGHRGNSVAAVDVRDVAGFWVGQDVTFHTVQFYYEKEDDRRLQAIAKRFGGEYEFIEEPPFDQTPGVDLFGISQ